MRRGVTALLAAVFFCQLCALVLGQGRSRDSIEPPWHIGPRKVENVAGNDIARANGDTPASEEREYPTPPELTVFPAMNVANLPKSPGPAVRGIYATAYSAGSSKKFGEIVSFIHQTEVNAIVIDVKDDTRDDQLSTAPYLWPRPAGRAGSNSHRPRSWRLFARRVSIRLPGSSPSRTRCWPPNGLIWPCEARPAVSGKTIAANSGWTRTTTKSGGTWWTWLKKRPRRGFVRFSSITCASRVTANCSDCLYPYANGQSKAEVIRDFLVYARQELKPLGVMYPRMSSG